MQPTIEWPLGRRATPEIPIHSHRRGTVRRGFLFAAAAGDEQPDLTYLADFAGFQKLHRLHMMRPNTPMQAHLHHAFGRPCGVENGAAFFHRVRGGFLKEHMGACFNRRNRRQCVPVVGRGDDHNLRLLLAEHLAKVIVLARLIAVEIGDFLGAYLARLLAHVANAHHLALTVRHRVAQNVHTPPARSDDRRAIFFAGSRQ